MIVQLISINAIPSETILVVSSFHISVNENGTPSKIVLNVALDREKAGTIACEFPVFLSADGNYKTVAHLEMLNLFRIGAPFVPVKCTDLKIFCSEAKEERKYFATAIKFEVVDYSEVEDIV